MSGKEQGLEFPIPRVQTNPCSPQMESGTYQFPCVRRIASSVLGSMQKGAGAMSPIRTIEGVSLLTPVPCQIWRYYV